ncbi:MAG: NAD-binding protein [Mycobacteriaceae bacterium]
MRGHIIVCGDDALATRIIGELSDAEISVMTLESPSGLAAAEIETARAVICASGDDALNLEVALLARRANPHVRVVARLANSVLHQAMSGGNGPGAVLDVADLAAPSVVEALLGRTEHPIPVGAVNFVVSSAAAPRDGTLREIYGRLAPVAIIRGEDSPSPGEVIACPQLDVPVHAGDWITMIGRAEELAEQGLGIVRQGEPAPRRRSPLGRAFDAVRAFRDDINPTFYRALAVLLTLLFSSTLILRFCFRNPSMTWMDALYFSTETLATVGYGDFNFMHQHVWLRLWGVVMMLGGLATIAVVVSFVADVLVSRRLAQSAGRQKARHLRSHFVVVGLGSFGTRVAGVLKEAGHDVVVIERNADNRYLALAAELNIPVVFGDATLRTTLAAARAEHARAIAVLTEDDVVNIEIGIVLQEILGPRRAPESESSERPRIVLRIYDRDLGAAVGHRLGFEHVRSTVDLATPWFIGAAMGLDVLGTFSVGQRSFMVGGVQVRTNSELDGTAMFELSTQTRVIAIERVGAPTEMHPHRDTRLHAGDTAYLVGPYHELLATLRQGQRTSQSGELRQTD